MVGGFNTNVRYRGRIFHVQTEDSGLDNPHIVTLLYEGGAILFSKKCGYADRLADGDPETVVRDLMEQQHRAMVQQLKGGGFDGMLGVDDNTATQAPGRGGRTAPAPSFGEGIVSDRPLDEVVLSYLASN